PNQNHQQLDNCDSNRNREESNSSGGGGGGSNPFSGLLDPDYFRKPFSSLPPTDQISEDGSNNLVAFAAAAAAAAAATAAVSSSSDSAGGGEENRKRMLQSLIHKQLNGDCLPAETADETAA